VNEVVLVGGDEEAASEFNVGSAFAFGDPFGVLLKEGKEFFSGGDFAPVEEAVADEKDVFDEEVVEVDDVSYFDDLLRSEGAIADLEEGLGDFFFELVEFAEVVGGGADKAFLFVGSAAFASLGAVSHRFLDALFPVGFFTPAREAEVGGKSAGEVDRFARGVPGEVQVGREVNICFKDVAVDFDAVRFVVFF